MAVSQTLYRDGMARLGAAVNIITTTSREGHHGLTASAVCSVTDTPPTLLVCINRSSRSHDHFIIGGSLCVNVLTPDHKAISTVFAGRDEMQVKFSSGEWHTLETGAPVLKGAAASFDCRITQSMQIGTHSVLFCEVQTVALDGRNEGLIYFNRAYHEVGG